MDAKRIVENTILAYQNQIKPTLESGNYFVAGMDLGNHRLALLQEKERIINTIHCGASFLSSLMALEDLCCDENPNPIKIKIAREHFEAYAAQTKLPMDLDTL